jgi:hypothetical protein
VSAMNILIFLVLGWVFQFLSAYISRKRQVTEGA